MDIDEIGGSAHDNKDLGFRFFEPEDQK